MVTMTDDDKAFDACADPAVVNGTCIVISDGKMIYAGPIHGAPSIEGATCLISPHDFSVLEAKVLANRKAQH